MISAAFCEHCLLEEFCISSRCGSATSMTIFSTTGLLLAHRRVPLVLWPEAFSYHEQQVEHLEHHIAERVVLSVFEVEQQDVEHLVSEGYANLLMQDLQDGVQVRAQEEVLHYLQCLELDQRVGVRQKV